MNRTEIVMQYHGEVNKIYEGTSAILAHMKTHELYTQYLVKLKAMLKGNSLTLEDYHWITDSMLAINTSKI